MPSSDLTLAEVAEGKQYGLNAETTYTLKNLYGQRAVQAQKEKHQETWFEERQKVVREVRAELEPKMLEAAKMEVRSQLEAVFPDEMRVRIRKEIEAEIAATVPTNRQREAAKRACGEIEIEALTEARAASSLAEATVKERDDSAPLYRIVFRFFMFAFLPVLALAHHHGWTAEDVKLWAVGIPWLVATCVAGVASGDFETKMKKKITGYRTLVKEHRNVARKARETRLVHIDVANTRGVGGTFPAPLRATVLPTILP